MRKVLIFISIILVVITGCASNYVTSSDQAIKDALSAGINILDNPGFETGNEDNWGFSDFVNISTTKVHSGTYSAMFAPIGGTEYFYNVVTADSQLTGRLIVSAWVNLSSAFDADCVILIMERQLKGGRNDLYTTHPEKKSGWQQVIIEVPSAEIGVQNLVVKATVNSAQGPVYFDDFAIVEASGSELSFIRNGSFSDYGSNWSGYSYGYGRDGNGSLLDFSKKNSELMQSTAWYAETRPYFDATQDMLLSVYVAPTEDSEGTIRLSIERKPTGERIHKDYKIKAGSGWQRIELPIAGTDEDIDETILHITVIDGIGTAIVDDVKLAIVNLGSQVSSGTMAENTSSEPVVTFGNVLRNSGLEDLNPDGTTLHWDIWPGNPNEGVRNFEIDTTSQYKGDRSLKINLEIGNAQAVYQYCVADTVGKFDFNKEYTFSCALKLEDVMTFDGKGVVIGIKRRGIDGNEYNVYKRIDESTTDWTVYEVTAESAPVEIVQYDVILDIGAGIGSVSIDDCQLKIAEPKEEESIIDLAWE